MLAKFRFSLAVFCAMLHGTIAASAATVSNQAGTVLVNNGNGFSPIAANAELAPGSQILVQQGGLASIAYANNCTVRVGSGLWLVQAAPPCANGATEIDFTGRMSQGAPPPPAGLPPLLIGGVIVAGAVGAAVLVSQNNRDSGASP